MLRLRVGGCAAETAVAAGAAGDAVAAEGGHYAPAAARRTHDEAGRGALPGGLCLLPTHRDQRLRLRLRSQGMAAAPICTPPRSPVHLATVLLLGSLWRRSGVPCRMHSSPSQMHHYEPSGVRPEMHACGEAPSNGTAPRPHLSPSCDCKPLNECGKKSCGARSHL